MKKSIGWYAEKMLRVIKGPDFRIFIIFLCISFFIWLIEKLRQNYTIEMTYHIECHDVPDEYVVDTEDMEAIHAVVSGEGLELLMLPTERKRAIGVDISQMKKTVVNGQTMAILIPRKFTHEVAQSLPDHIALEHIEADTVYIPLLTKVRKMLPVVVRDNVTLEAQHMFSEPRLLEPDSVWISGTNDKVDTMKAVYTREMQPITLHDSIRLSMEFDLPRGVEASAMEAQVTYFVEPYTEKVLNVPITAINTPAGYRFKAFPQTVSVTLSVGLSQYDKLTPNDIDIIADLQDVKIGSSQQKIKVRLAEYPTFIKSISYSPLFVEYLLERKHVKTTVEE